MLNFKQFMQKAAAWLNGSNDTDPMGQLNLPINSIEIPTTSTKSPVEIYRVRRQGKTYEICAENNITWYCPAMHYIHLLHIGKAPQVGDKVMLEFYRDGSVKSYSIVSKRQRGFAG
jgi:hypothetical protein